MLLRKFGAAQNVQFYRWVAKIPKSFGENYNQEPSTQVFYFDSKSNTFLLCTRTPQNLDNKIPDADHVKLTHGPQVPHPWHTRKRQTAAKGEASRLVSGKADEQLGKSRGGRWKVK